MNDKKFCIMLLTCDEYCDLWPFFLRELRKFWPEYRGKIFINTESIRNILNESYGYEIEFPKMTFPPKGSWGERLLKCIEQIQEDYIFFMLDDFILTGKVDDGEINRCISYLCEDKNIACFNYRPSSGETLGETFGKYELKNLKAPFRINLQAALWRKQFLMKFIRKHENPWQFETWGSIRARRYKDKIYHLRYNEEDIVPYPEGGVIADRRWRGNEAIELMKKIGYDLDLTKREIYYEGDPRKTEIVHRSFGKKCWQVIQSLI